MRRAGRRGEADRWTKTTLWVVTSDWEWLRAREQSAAQVLRNLLAQYRAQCTARWDEDEVLDRESLRDL